MAGGVDGEAQAAEPIDKRKGEKPKGDRSFPFASGTDHDVRDNVAVGHVRDHSRFLAPRGFGDILLSGAILLRGLMVNLLLLLAVLLPLAMIVVITNPTTGHLDHSIWLDIARWFRPDWDKGPGQGVFGSIVADPLIMTKAIAALLALSLVGWALWRSFVESFYGRFGSATLEHQSRWTWWGRYLLVSLLIAFLVEVQPRILSAIIASATKAGDAGPSATNIQVLVAAATAVVAATATFRGTLIAWIQKALSSPTMGARLQAAFAQAAFYALGLALPLLIYGLFLLLIISGMKVTPCQDCGNRYPFAPGFLVAQNWWLVSILAGFVAVFTLVRWILISFVAQYEGPGKVGGALQTLWRRGSGKLTTLSIVLLLAFLAVSAIATRPDPGNWFGHDDELMVLANYLAITFVIVVLGLNFTENANGLHRLYRDRLSVAFRLGHPITGASLKLHELDHHAPYLLVNGTLNVRRPLRADSDADAPGAVRVCRGRGGSNAGMWEQTRLGLNEASRKVRSWMSRKQSSPRPELEPSKRVVQQRRCRSVRVPIRPSAAATPSSSFSPDTSSAATRPAMWRRL